MSLRVSSRLAPLLVACAVAGACGGEVTPSPPSPAPSSSSPSSPSPSPGGAPVADAGPACTGAAPVCCVTDANGCSLVRGHATCGQGVWTCPAGGDPTAVCAGTCAADASPYSPACSGEPPACCTIDANGCATPVDAVCEDAWVCPGGENPGVGDACSHVCADAGDDAG